jgi:epoxide hydrolase-like predicted phosphatase
VGGRGIQRRETIDSQNIVTVRAVFFDLGGVILRTEYQAPRQHLAERLNIEYDDLVRLVFESETSRKASIGTLTADEHWAALMVKLKRPASDAQKIHEEFFGGDVLDRELIQLIRSMRSKYKTGLISNAWGDLRQYIARQKFDDAFDGITISAEVGVVKPEAKIYHVALEQVQVQANEAVFVDDFPANIEGCEKVGMQGILFKDPDEVKQKLKALL